VTGLMTGADDYVTKPFSPSKGFPHGDFPARHRNDGTGRDSMLSAALLLFANTLLFSLRLSGGGSFPKPLSAAEEREYLRRYAQGDQEARDVLIERNLRLVAHIIKKYYTQSADQEDLISIGTIGLIKGISSFDPEKGARLATYAARCIENEILMYFRSQKKLQGEVSLSDSIETDKEGNALQLMDVVGVDDTMLDDIHDRDSALRLHQIIRERLTTREAEIIRLRYGLGGTIPLTQREIAASFGISRSYVSRIEKRALEKLRQELQDGPAPQLVRRRPHSSGT
ncbi:RNA polymerase sporulation sigma factor SigK, partial [Dysosmobacter welbionis]